MFFQTLRHKPLLHPLAVEISQLLRSAELVNAPQLTLRYLSSVNVPWLQIRPRQRDKVAVFISNDKCGQADRRGGLQSIP